MPLKSMNHCSVVQMSTVSRDPLSCQKKIFKIVKAFIVTLLLSVAFLVASYYLSLQVAQRIEGKQHFLIKQELAKLFFDFREFEKRTNNTLFVRERGSDLQARIDMLDRLWGLDYIQSQFIVQVKPLLAHIQATVVDTSTKSYLEQHPSSKLSPSIELVSENNNGW